MEKVYLGIDPSVKSTGYAVINEKGDLIDCGKICPNPENLLSSEIIFNQYVEIKKLFKKYQIEQVFCEDQFFGSNIDTLKKLSRISGMFLLVSGEEKVSIELIYPSSWRKIYHENGKATKKDTLLKVNKEFNLNLKTKDNDISDAIGIAMSCYMKNTSN